MAKNLTNTITIENEEYNINAKEADVAKKVQASLKINKSNLTDGTSEPVDFDGSINKEVTIVPASGGKFTGRITVPPHPNATVDSVAVLNYGDLQSRVLPNLINNSVLYSWDGSNLDATTGDAINSISIVKGSEDQVDEFAQYNKTSANKLPTYLYVCSDSGNIYLGTSESTDVQQLASIATKLADTHTFQTNLASTSKASFDGTQDVAQGVTGVLPIANGGTGSTVAAGACEYLIKEQNIQPGTIVIYTPGNTSQETYKHWLYGKYGVDLKNSDIIGLNALYFADASDTRNECINFINSSTTTNGETVVTYDRFYSQKGKLYYDPNRSIDDDFSATRREVYHTGSDFSGVTVGNATKLGNNAASYYQKKITVASKTAYPNGPTGGSNGDIFILY